jgi:hypothetical protein
MDISWTFWSNFARPLEDKQIPTPVEFYEWLVTDQTNEIKYRKPDFDCRDFAHQLVIHAREQKYQVGLVYMLSHFIDTKKEFNHAFNVIYLTDGLYYVEPQKDWIWSYPDHVEIEEGKDYVFGLCDPPLRIHVDRIYTIIPP